MYFKRNAFFRFNTDGWNRIRNIFSTYRYIFF